MPGNATQDTPSEPPPQQSWGDTNAISAVTDSWEAQALGSALGHVVENVGLHFLGGGAEYPARKFCISSKAEVSASDVQKTTESLHPDLKRAREAIGSFFPSSETLDKVSGPPLHKGSLTRQLFARERLGGFLPCCSWLRNSLPSAGNYVVDRQTGRKVFEPMPFCA